MVDGLWWWCGVRWMLYRLRLLLALDMETNDKHMA
jgi:hypothetical protein